MFSVASLEPPFTFSMKVTPEEFEELVALPGIVPAPYVARYHWVLLQEGHPISQPDLEKYLRQSYELVKAKLSKKDLKAAGLL